MASAIRCTGLKIVRKEICIANGHQYPEGRFPVDFGIRNCGSYAFQYCERIVIIAIVGKVVSYRAEVLNFSICIVVKFVHHWGLPWERFVSTNYSLFLKPHACSSISVFRRRYTGRETWCER